VPGGFGDEATLDARTAADQVESLLRRWPSHPGGWKAWLAWARFHPARPSLVAFARTLTGDPNHKLGAVTGTPTFAILKDPTVTTVSALPNPSLPGQAFTLTATVTVPAPGVGASTLNGS